MQERVHNLLFETNDVTWQSILIGLVHEEGMDPWDIDISVLSKKYHTVLQGLNKFDIRISAKVVFAAALLLRLKSTHLLEKDIFALEQLIESANDNVDDFYAELEEDYLDGGAINLEPPELVPRTPQPRKRKVALSDLMDALRKALEVRQRRVLREIETDTKILLPEKRRDMSEVILEIYNKILYFFRVEKRPLSFTDLIPSEDRGDKITTFIPLLHLATPPHGKIELLQKEAFGNIEIITVNHKA